MHAHYEQDPTNPRKVNLTITRDDGSIVNLFLNDAEPLNHVAASYSKSAEIVYRQHNGTEETVPLDFTRLSAFEHPISQPMSGRPASLSTDTLAIPTGSTVSFRQNNRWLGKDGWSETRQFLPVSEQYTSSVKLDEKPAEINPVIPPLTSPTAKVCHNTLSDGTVCNATNRLAAVVCYRCGDNSHFEFVY